ncbi:MAG: hypothetical protein PV353_00250, partial [Bartonella sp.]|nr:hypothetical protein [Bartonella sp.]
TVISRATDVLHQLEQGEMSGKGHKLIDNLPLFSLKATSLTNEKNDKCCAIKDALKNIHPDELSPKAALEELYRLKQLEEQ